MSDLLKTLRYYWWTFRRWGWRGLVGLFQFAKFQRAARHESPDCTHMGYAVADLKEKLQRNPHDHLTRGYLMSHYRKYDRAKLRQHTYRAIQEDPGHFAIFYANHAEFYQDAAYCQDVLARLLEAVQQRNEPDVHINIARLYETLGAPPASSERMAEWRRYFVIPDEVAIISEPNPTYVAEAHKHFQEAIALATPDDAFYQHHYRELYANFCEKVGARDKAIRLYEEAARFSLAGTGADGSESRTWITLGRLHWRSKDFERAKECLFKAIEIEKEYDDVPPDSTHVYTSEASVYLGLIAVDEGNVNAARQYLRQSIDADPLHAPRLLKGQSVLVEAR